MYVKQKNYWRGKKIKSYEFEVWSSLDSRYVIVSIEADSKTEAIKLFKRSHPHKKYRLLDDPVD